MTRLTTLNLPHLHKLLLALTDYLTNLKEASLIVLMETVTHHITSNN